MLDLESASRVAAAAMMKASVILRFLGALSAAVALLLLLVLRVTGCSSTPAARGLAGEARDAAQVDVSRPDCRAEGWGEAARVNADSVASLRWAPFGREEAGWEVYVPLIQHEIATTCPPGSEGFAAALGRWGQANGLPGDGILTETLFAELKGHVQVRRDFVRLTAAGMCPDAWNDVVQVRYQEGYAGKPVLVRPAALLAYRRMVADAKASDPEIGKDPHDLTIFSGYRSPAADAERCREEGNCDGVVRARCSAHRTGLALDIYVGHAEGYGPDSSADPNRLAMTKTAAYRWLVANAERYGFQNYPFEPWHWEWTGEAP